MSTARDDSFVFRVLALYDDYELHEFLYWQTGADGGVRFYANCNDLFAWGCSDADEITSDNIGALESALADVAAVQGYATSDALLLFCARLRGMRPQGAMYEHIPRALWPLFDACGPERITGLGNPKPQPALFA
jgi:hypothetical protein